MNPPIPEEASTHECKFVVRYEIEVCAVTPEEAAKLARGRMRNPDVILALDVSPMLRLGDDWFPSDDIGWRINLGADGEQVELATWEARES